MSATSGLSATLAAQHLRCDALLAAAEEALRAQDWAAFPRRLAALRQGLLDHFWLEEEEIFPAFERAAGGSAQALRAQHKHIREILDALGAASPRHDPEGFREEFGALATLLRQHAAEEENVLYPALGRAPAGPSGSIPPGAGPADPVEQLDVRGLEPPEPFVRIVAALARSPGVRLRVLIHREPFPLYDALEERGLRWHTRALEDGSFEILIERSKA
jgi:hemerythrin superfamily protein